MHSSGIHRVATCLLAGSAILSVAGCLRSAAPAPESTDATVSSSSPTSTARPGTTNPAATGAWAGFTAPAAQWAAWKPVMADVRPATDEDLAALGARAQSVAGRSFTVTAVGGLGEFEMSWSPTHARVLFGARGTTYLETHSTPVEADQLDRDALLRAPLTVCVHDEKECTEITGDEDPADRPHLFDTMTDSLVYESSASTTAQIAAAGLLDDLRGQVARAGVTTIASPIGPLDCVVVVEDAAHLASLEGANLEEARSDAGLPALCLDARGLVVVALDGSFRPVLAYTSMRPDVPAGFDTPPFAVHPFS